MKPSNAQPRRISTVELIRFYFWGYLIARSISTLSRFRKHNAKDTNHG